MRVVILLGSLWGLCVGVYGVDPLVSTKLGLIKGLRDENGFARFLGVPYGKLNVDNIFGEAQPHPAFNNVFEAYDDSNICVQLNNGNPIGTIDCLNVNIFVPNTATSENRLPVMVNIHGGAFVHGSASRDASNPISLLRHDVIVVSINYRLGIYGFMCLDIPEVPGNTGLKDQALALRWIKENIEAFGGDANQITVFGESAGAVAINLHLYSTNEKLFNRAIIQSGPAISPIMMTRSHATIPVELAKELGLNTSDIKEALAFLSDVDPHTLAQVAFESKITNDMVENGLLTIPCVEKSFEGINNFITEHPINIKSYKVSTTPIMIGYTVNEFGRQYGLTVAEYFENYDFGRFLTQGFEMEDFHDAIDAVRHFYIGDEDVSEDLKWDIADFASDFAYNHPTQRAAQKFLVEGASSVYRYVFSYESKRNDRTWSGATHGEDMFYVFDMKLGVREKTELDQLVIDRVTSLWTNFAKYGNPTPQTSDLLPVTWTPITEHEQPFLDIDADLVLKGRPFNKRMAFWDLFYRQYGRHQKWVK